MPETYQSFSGADIVATFNGQVVGELLSLTYSVTREKAPNYTMGSANPRGYARGKRGIAGNLVFAVFNRNALMEEMRNHEDNASQEDIGKFWTYGTENDAGETETSYTGNDGHGIYNINEFNEMMQRAAGNGDLLDEGGQNIEIEYADQLQPFDITVNFMNEMGEKAKLSLFGCEILNEGMGFSVQDLSTNVQYSFVARDLEELTSKGNMNDG
jgi:hypothetical protein